MIPPVEAARQLIELIVEEGQGQDIFGRRIIANRIIGALSGWQSESRKEIARDVSLEPMTDEEAKRFGKETMTFGKHCGKQIDSVDLDYLSWLADNSRQTWRNLHRYLNSPRIRIERIAEEDSRENLSP